MTDQQDNTLLICRLCLSEDQLTISLFSDNELQQKISYIFKFEVRQKLV